MEPLIEVSDLEKRLGKDFDETETEQAEAFIEDASALVRDIADKDFEDDDGEPDVPKSIVPVVVSMVRRAMNNPRGLQSETIGDYSYEMAGSQQTAMYVTKSERRTIRRAVGKGGVGAITLEAKLPPTRWNPQYGFLEDWIES